MNKQRVEQAIAIMERAGLVDMRFFQNSGKHGGQKATEAEVHECGNTACFAGWVAVSPEFIAVGGRKSPNGNAILDVPEEDDYYVGSEAIQKWLDISEDTAVSLVYGDTFDKLVPNTGVGSPYKEYSRFYDKPWEDVKAPDVIAKLKLILSGELK